jgi:hypothetical protein
VRARVQVPPALLISGHQYSKQCLVLLSVAVPQRNSAAAQIPPLLFRMCRFIFKNNL